MRLLALPALALTLILTPAFAAKKHEAAAPPPKIFIAPNNGFESYVAAAIVKKHVPVTVTLKKEDADYVINSVVTKQEEKTGLGKLARCAYALCIGIDGNNAATVMMIDRSENVVWAYNVYKSWGANQFQSAAEAIAKHLKGFIRSKE